MTCAGLLSACGKEEAPPGASASATTASAESPAEPSASAEPADAASGEASPERLSPTPTATPSAEKPQLVDPKAQAQEAASIQKCCSALSAAANKDGPDKKKYRSAASVCSGIVGQIKAGKANAAAARTTIRAQIVGAPVPGGC